MKKGSLILLCALLFLIAAAGIGAWFTLTPRGVLRQDLPGHVMQEYFSGRTREDWKTDFIRLESPETTEFEDPAAVAGAVFDSAAGDSPLSFREIPVADRSSEAAFVVSAGDADLLQVDLEYSGKAWSVTGVSPLGAVKAETYAAEITVPSGTQVRVNGIPLGGGYAVETDMPYENMSELELRFETHPVKIKYEIPGLYRNVTVDADRDGGLLLLYADGQRWSYTLPDEGAYSYKITVPQQATATVGGVTLTSQDAAASLTCDTKLDIPDELMGDLPSYTVFTAGGLSSPDYPVTAVMPDGTVLEGAETEDGLFFPVPSSEELYQECHQRVESFIHDLLEYGAGHTARFAPQFYAVPSSPVYSYIRNAISSLMFTVNVTLTFDEIRSFSYYPLGEDAFVCQAHADCHTSTYYQKKDLSLGYEMLWVRDEKGVWLVQDLAFT